eukprot:scaffold10750_cov78-Skeletonema_dohrnii-CCMP3373.AAC.1
MHSMGQRRLALGHNGHICRIILGAKIAILAEMACDTHAVPDCYDPKQAAAVPYYAPCPLISKDFQRIDVHGVQVYSTNFN